VGDFVRCLDVRMRIDDHPADGCLLQMPLLRKDALSRPRADQFGVAVLDIVALQQAGCDVEHLLSGAFRSGDDVSVGRVGHRVFDQQPSVAEDGGTVVRIGRIGELDEQVFGIQHRFFGGWIN
jgi:hypothetical protein